jgi:putative aldouronate transport system substrate-binding protein
MYRLIEMANDGAYVTASNQHVPETMRWLDALLDTETMFSTYYGPNGWVYNDEKLIESTVTGSEEIKDWLDCNTLFFAPAKYITSVFKMSPQRVEKTEYSDQYEAAGVMQKYSDDYLKLAPLTSEQIQNNSLTETDINNAVVEYAAKFITEGVTDESWDAFVKLFDDMGAADYIKTYQDAIDQLEIQ